MARDGFQINERGMRDMERQLQKRFDKMKLSVPVDADLGSHNVFITGDKAQVVVGDNNGSMAQGDVQVPPQYEGLAVAIQQMRDLLRSSDLSPEDAAGAEDAAHEALEALTQPAPDQKLLRRAVASLRGFAVPFMTSVGTEAGQETLHQVVHLMSQLQLP